jgi:hypothetical protein
MQLFNFAIIGAALLSSAVALPTESSPNYNLLTVPRGISMEEKLATPSVNGRIATS